MSGVEGVRRQAWAAGRVAAARPPQDGAMRLADGVPVDPESVSRMLGGALSEIHTLPTDDAPIPMIGTGVLLARVRAHVDVDASATSDGPYRGIAPARLLEIVAEQMAGLDDAMTTVVHGSLNAADVWIHPEAGLTIAGWTDSGLGDPHLDLAMGARLLGDTYGFAVAGPFFEAYGIDKVDALRLDAFQLLAHLLSP